jgi:O-antigen ligase
VRSELLEAGLRMFGDHMWFGVGVGNYKPLIGAYAGSDVELKHLAHNTYLEVAAEQGLFGLSLFLMILGLTLRSLRRTRKQGAASRDVLVSTAAGAIEIGLLGGAVAMLFLSALHVRLFWFMVALSACLPSLTAARRPARSRSSSIEPTQAALTHGR